MLGGGVLRRDHGDVTFVHAEHDDGHPAAGVPAAGARPHACTARPRWSPGRPTAHGGRRTPRSAPTPPGWPTPCATTWASPATSGSATLMWNNAEHLVAYLAVPEHGRGAAHPQPAAVPGAVDLHRQPRRGPGDHRRLDADPVAGRGAAAADARCATSSWSAAATRPRWRRRRPGRRCTAGTTCSRGKPDRYDWPEIDERDAAALCYTSGTTGNPKGVAYSHRSIYLHSMQVCSAEAFGLGAGAARCSPSCRCSTRWPGACRTRRSCPGPSLIMPDRFLQAAPLADHDRRGAPDARRRGADHLDRPARAPRRQPDRHRRRWGRSSSAARPARPR